MSAETGEKLVDVYLWAANDTQTKAMTDTSSGLNFMSEELATRIGEPIQPLNAGESKELPLLNCTTVKLSGRVVAWLRPDGSHNSCRATFFIAPIRVTVDIIPSGEFLTWHDDH